MRRSRGMTSACAARPSSAQLVRGKMEPVEESSDIAGGMCKGWREGSKVKKQLMVFKFQTPSTNIQRNFKFQYPRGRFLGRSASLRSRRAGDSASYHSIIWFRAN